jgi:hypothetical protein
MQKMSGKPGRTLQLQRPFGHTLLIAAGFLLLYLLAAEMFVRITAVQATLGSPTLGTQHRQFEQQWARLQAYAATRDTIDCLVVGDSTVMSNIAPQELATAYQQQTGETIECYNFGVGAFAVLGLTNLTEILIDEYSPRLIIVGVEALNFTVPWADQQETDLARTAWGRYKRGEFSPIGWLYDHSYLYGYLGVLGQLFTWETNLRDVRQTAVAERQVVVEGYFPLTETWPFAVDQPPDPTIEHPYMEHYFASLSPFRLLPENMAALNALAALNTADTRIMLLEMPVPETFYSFFGNDEQDYHLFVQTVRDTAVAHHIPFLRLDNWHTLPYPLWYNYNHLNIEGAPVFSRWLGAEVGKLDTANLEGQ